MTGCLRCARSEDGMPQTFCVEGRCPAHCGPDVCSHEFDDLAEAAESAEGEE